ncbi:MAG TPA: hypothetical protein PLL37_00250 [Bacillota bacterium]|nr:hypothetical protein [Bacillota bacterium]
MKVLDVNFSTPWLITTLIYIMFIIYQILYRVNEQIEKGRIKEILYCIIDTINGIPLVNKDNKIIIQWDVIFKKLIDKKEYFLYDNIIKIKTKNIDRYVNQYPSLLFNSSMDMLERKSKIDTKSIVKGKESGLDDISKGLDIDEDMKKILFVKYLSNNKMTLANFDSSIYFDIVVNDEYEPPEYEKFGIQPDDRYDGFSLVAYHKDKKYILVPRIMLFGKRIDKEKWLYRNIDRIIKCAENIAAGIEDYLIIVDELSLKDLTTDYYGEDAEVIPPFFFERLDNDILIFSGIVKGKEVSRAYCTLETSHNGFEIKMQKYELIIDGISEVVEEEKTIAIGNAYQPIVALMEKMPTISNNIKLAILKKDIEDLVIK